MNLICTECNDEFVQILDVPTRHEVIGKSLFELAPHLKRSSFEEVLKTGQPYRRSGGSAAIVKSGAQR